ncbi:MAG: dihydrofolate reductase [Candidatus Peribacteraceae bacterium]|nr:dihydrofolate reductase [Candidatus Peribacteraceae bacterium]
MIISLVAAASENNVIGKQGAIPWDLPDDFRHFHDATKGCPIIMGRRTHESIGRVLPGRRNIIITRSRDYLVDGCDTVHSMEEAIELARSDAPAKACVIGGGEIYAQALPYANEIDLTRVHMDVEGGDAFFPEFSADEWELSSSKKHPVDERHAVPFTFLLYRRKL